MSAFAWLAERVPPGRPGLRPHTRLLAASHPRLVAIKDRMHPCGTQRRGGSATLARAPAVLRAAGLTSKRRRARRPSVGLRGSFRPPLASTRRHTRAPSQPRTRAEPMMGVYRVRPCPRKARRDHRQIRPWPAGSMRSQPAALPGARRLGAAPKRRLLPWPLWSRHRPPAVPSRRARCSAPRRHLAERILDRADRASSGQASALA